MAPERGSAVTGREPRYGLVLIVWALVLAGLYLFQQAFS